MRRPSRPTLEPVDYWTDRRGPALGLAVFVLTLLTATLAVWALATRCG